MLDLSPTQIAFLRRLANLRLSTASTSQTAEYFYADQRLGTPRGQQFSYTEEDWARAERILKAHGIAREEPARAGRRSDVTPRPGVNEKSGTQAPHSDSIAVKTAAGACLLDGEPISKLGYTVLTFDQVQRVKAQRLMAIENMDTFRHLERCSWIDYEGLDVLAVFRGDNRLRADEALTALKARHEPVWAFYDFDPAGLGFASQLPRLERLVLPGRLHEQVRAADQARLFVHHLHQWEDYLDACSIPIIQTAWRDLKELRAGLAQELMGP